MTSTINGILMNYLNEIPLTHSSTAKQEAKQEERGSCQPLYPLQKSDRNKTLK